MRPERTPSHIVGQEQEAFRIHEADLRAALQRMETNYAQLERTQSQLRAIIDASPDGRPIKVNTRFTEFFGLDDVSMLSQMPDQLMTLIQNLFERSECLDGSQVWSTTDHEHSFREALIQVSPSQREFDLVSLPVTNIDHTYIGRLYVWHDMTHEREVDRMRSTLASMVTHELRSPLTCINGFIELLLAPEMTANMTEEQHDFLTIVQNETHRMLALTRDLLDISHLESGPFEWSAEPINLNHLIEKLIPSFQLSWETRQQTFTLHVPVPAPIVRGDAERVTQILTNLLSNAHKYTPDGGSIDLTIESMGSVVSIAITDTGIGLSTEEQSRLFTRFYRADNATTKSVAGTGLGLTITRMLVEMQGGEIHVSSRPGHGSTFRVTLPACLPEEPGKDGTHH